jgi:hypothetical protein
MNHNDPNFQQARGISPGTKGVALDSPEFIEGAFNRESLSRWRDELRSESMPDQLVFERLVGILHPVLEYIGSSCSPTMMAVRMWCLLYAVRPDLIEYESLVSAERRFGVSEQVIHKALREIESAIPGFSYLRRQPDNVTISKRLTSKTKEGRWAIQRRIVLKKAGASIDHTPDELEEERCAIEAKEVA